MIYWRLKPDFHSRFSLVASEIFRMGHAQSVSETNRTGRKYLSLCSHLKFKYFNFCEIFLQRNQSDFFLESCGHFMRIEKFSQNGRPTALSGLREDRSQYILKNKNYRASHFSLATVFRLDWRKWRLILLPRYFSLTKNSFSDRRKI